MTSLLLLLALSQLTGSGSSPAVTTDTSDQQFEQMADEYIDKFPALSPVSATALGDHRFDRQLNEVTEQARQNEVAFYKGFLDRLGLLDPSKLSRENQVDHSLLSQELRRNIWEIETLQSWAWDPLIYTGLSGDAIYGLMAREFAPLPERLECVSERLAQLPRLLDQVRKTLVPARVPKIHAQTAVNQNRGVLSILDHMIKPNLGKLSADKRSGLERSMATARDAVEAHQTWLESELLPNAKGDFRLGEKLYDEKLAFTLKSPLTRSQVRERAEQELVNVRGQMYEVSCEVYKQLYPYTEFPNNPSRKYKQAIIRAALEVVNRDAPPADKVVETAKESLRMTTDFVRENDLITLPPDPVEVIIMPEFQRGVSLAYCDSPGAFDVGLTTYYAVAPLPTDWTQTQIESFLREYNVRSIHDLTMHEAMPGHYVQLAHANRYPGKLRAVLSSGVFIEGWAIYSERMMIDQGFLDHDPLMRLINLKWYLRGIGNAIIDQAIHVEGMTRDQAMKLMVEDTFQEEREAAAKWVRAQLTSAQLATYFVGTQELFDLRREVEESWGDDFELKKYHDKILSYGSPPTQYVHALVLDKEIPRSSNPR